MCVDVTRIVACFQLRAFIDDLVADPTEFLCDREAISRHVSGAESLQDLLCDRDVLEEIDDELRDVYITPYNAVVDVSPPSNAVVDVSPRFQLMKLR